MHLIFALPCRLSKWLDMFAIATILYRAMKADRYLIRGSIF